LEARIEALTRLIERVVRTNPDARRLLEIPGIGPLTASALIATVGDARQLKHGR
jgi:transposase